MYNYKENFHFECYFSIFTLFSIAYISSVLPKATGQNGGAITNTFVPLVLQKRLTYVPARQSLDPDQDESDFGLTLKIFLLRYFVLHVLRQCSQTQQKEK